MVILGELAVTSPQYGVGLSSREWSPEQPRYIRITDIRDDGELTGSKVAPDGSKEDWQKALLKPGDLLFARSGATVGKTYLHREVDFDAVYAGYLIRFQFDADRVIPEYVFRYTQSVQYRSWVAASQRAVAQPNVNAKQYASLAIPLPPLDVQRRVVEILTHADTLRAKRREAIARLDELTQSIFIDMFGDPVANDRSWPTVPVGDFVAGFDSGKNLVGSDSDSEFRVLKVSAVTSLMYREPESKPLPAEYVPPTQHLVRAGDILFSRANTSELIGATAYVHETDGRTALPDKLWRFRWNDSLRPEPRFVEKLFQRPSFRKKVSDLASGSSGSMKNISQAKVLGIIVGLPPRSLQAEFAGRIDKIERSKRQLEESLRLSEKLFRSLQSRAFRGEL